MGEAPCYPVPLIIKGALLLLVGPGDVAPLRVRAHLREADGVAVLTVTDDGAPGARLVVTLPLHPQG